MKNDQVCYEMDVNKYIGEDRETIIRQGLHLVVDNNLDRQMDEKAEGGAGGQPLLYLDTIGNCFSNIYLL